ncbi:fungal-specific transcription factor domain-containing protein [Penicillium canariense]|uniref:Fungal-specific transcription factor domain-containing protein n=1 Tax=Penicillium canariense TaxID=189055 RepID=A0A9W9I1R7_9EURO|nr:fungal-specific transcription factor domain-containing protein [Penicillium canariense]KAJ5160465.1 fungal-specific transcription factor domain-containing protein [Penicillium canariense]
MSSLRKKKCDETKPHCVACARNKLECKWPPHIIRIFGLDSDHASDAERRARWGTERSTSDCSIATSASPPGRDPRALQVVESHEKHADTTRGYAIAWSKGLNTFLSPRRAGLLLPASQTLLAHYLEMTGPLLATAPAQSAPFVSWVMPIAYNDDLVMHSVLALSGAHLSFRAETLEIKQAVYQHYCLVLKSLRQISQPENLLSDPFALLRVALTLVILCHYEVLSGSLDGSFFTHLRASRHIVLELRNKRHQIKTDAERKLYGFVMELYAYFVLCNGITPFGMNENRALIYDSFLQSLDDLKDFGAFGVMFGGGHGLFEIISSISLFAAQQELMRSSPQSIGTPRVLTARKWTGPPAVEQCWKYVGTHY